MLKVGKTALAILLLLALLPMGCAAGTGGAAPTASPADDTADTVLITDSLGTKLRVKKSPQRVAVLFSSLADIWVTSGGSIAVTVGEAVERGFAPADAVLVAEGSGHDRIDLETLTCESPDLVICTADYAGQVEAASFCNGIGIPAACFRVESFTEYLQVLTIFCELTERPELLETYGTQVQASIDELLALAAAKEPAYQHILFLRCGSSASSAKAKTANEHFACAMLDELGTYNIANDSPVLLDSLSLEVIFAADPDYIFITTMGDEASAKAYVESLLASAGWRELSAVKNGSYSFLPKELFQFKPNARWAEAYAYLYDILYGA